MSGNESLTATAANVVGIGEDAGGGDEREARYGIQFGCEFGSAHRRLVCAMAGLHKPARIICPIKPMSAAESRTESEMQHSHPKRGRGFVENAAQREGIQGYVRNLRAPALNWAQDDRCIFNFESINN